EVRKAADRYIVPVARADDLKRALTEPGARRSGRRRDRDGEGLRRAGVGASLTRSAVVMQHDRDRSRAGRAGRWRKRERAGRIDGGLNAEELRLAGRQLEF